MQVIAALGLDRLAGSGLLWLLVAITAVVWVARRLFPQPLLRLRGDGNAARATAERLARDLRDAGDGAPPRRIRRLSDDRATRIEFGALAWGRRLSAAGAVLGVLLAAWALAAPAPLVLEISPGAAGTPSAAAAWNVEAGHLVPAVAAPNGGCSTAGAGLRCRLSFAGESHEFSLNPGDVAHVGSRQIAWIGAASDADSGVGRLFWRPKIAENGPWYALDVTVGRVLNVPSLQARLALLASSRSGSLIFGQRTGPDGTGAFVLAAPELLPKGRATARLQTPARARLLVTFDVPPALLALALLAAILGALLLFAVPGIEIEVSAVDGTVSVLASNRQRLLGTVRQSDAEAVESTTEAAP